MRNRAAFLDTAPSVWPACHSDACGQGRKACPCPEACQRPLPRPRRPEPWRLRLWVAIAFLAAFWSGVGLWWWAR